MDRINLKASALIVFFLFISGGADAIVPASPKELSAISGDTVYAKQLLYNGRVWESKYLNIADHEFFGTRNCIIGNVTINDTIFRNILLRYDIFNDEIIVMIDQFNFVQLNREAVKDFTLMTPQGLCLFENCDRLSSKINIGYGEVIYKGQSMIVKKHYKKIKKLAIENKYDAFVYSDALFLITNGNCFRISTKKDFYKAFYDKIDAIKKYIHDNKIRVRIRKAETMTPVMEYYDSLSNGNLP